MRTRSQVLDVAIAGGGPVGSTLAVALAASGLAVELLDARSAADPPPPDRPLALSRGSRLILERLGVWQALVATPGAVTDILTVDVSHRGGFGAVRMEASEQGVGALGHVVGYRALQSVLDATIERTGASVARATRVGSIKATPAYAEVRIDDGRGAGPTAEPLIARLVVIADGAGVAARGIGRYRYDYRQSAIVGVVEVAEPHRGVAWERFTPDGPVALLPFEDGYALVWTVQSGRAAELLARGAAGGLLGGLRAQIGGRLPALLGVRDVASFPLALEFAPSITAERTVLVGNAAQTLHPVAGQGLNLGLRDAYELAVAILDCPRDEIGGRAMLERHRRGRRIDRAAGVGFTHALSGLFAIRSPLVATPRSLALTLLDALPPAKRAFTRAMLFGLR